MSNEWKLVPVEPTEEMLRCGWCAAGEFGIDEYRAMLAAAPMSPFRITVHADLIDDGTDQAGRLQAAIDFASGIAPQIDESKIVARIDWDGEGLPPIGAVCEFSDHKEPATWAKCRVIAFEGEAIVFKILQQGHFLEYDARYASSLRPIRLTVAEQRNAELLGVLAGVVGACNLINTKEALAIAALVDASLNKLEKEKS